MKEWGSTMSSDDRNAQVIADFRANSGVVGGDRPGRPIVLLTSPGRRSGTMRTTPVLYFLSGDRYCVFATHGGSDEDPDWYCNMMAARAVEVEVPGAQFRATPVVLSGEERDLSYAKQTELFPQFGDYQRKTTRQIPVVALVPTTGSDLPA